jgi:hypothetical protein
VPDHGTPARSTPQRIDAMTERPRRALGLSESDAQIELAVLERAERGRGPRLEAPVILPEQEEGGEVQARDERHPLVGSEHHEGGRQRIGPDAESVDHRHRREPVPDGLPAGR